MFFSLLIFSWKSTPRTPRTPLTHILSLSQSVHVDQVHCLFISLHIHFSVTSTTCVCVVQLAPKMHVRAVTISRHCSQTFFHLDHFYVSLFFFHFHCFDFPIFHCFSFLEKALFHFFFLIFPFPFFFLYLFLLVFERFLFFLNVLMFLPYSICFCIFSVSCLFPVFVSVFFFLSFHWVMRVFRIRFTFSQIPVPQLYT